MVNEWARDDLPSLPDVLGDVTTHERSGGAAAYRTAALAYLNAHHPKPYPEDATLRVVWRERALEAERYLVDARRERDAAVARAEKAERERDEAVGGS